MIKLGKETEKTYIEFETEMDDETHAVLLNYAKEHIMQDEEALVNYAFVRILTEQVARLKTEDVDAAKSTESEENTDEQAG